MPAATFQDDLGGVGELTFSSWCERTEDTNALLLKSSYRQPFGTFSGRLEGHELKAGYGVMEAHQATW